MVKTKKKGGGGANLGRSLLKDRFGHTQRRTVDNNNMLHTTEVQDGYNWGRLNLNSVTEESSFQEFVRTAELAGAEFKAEKMNVSFVDNKRGVGLLTNAQELSMRKKHTEHSNELRIPRRPKWTTETTGAEQDEHEKASFLEWRRSLALLQENEGLLLTPYEKNLQFWRQLWRGIELSDVVLQIVDARNPLLFRCADLEQYVREVDARKQNVILVNKSDYLTAEQRKYWAEYFDQDGIRALFFSATMAEDALKEAEEALKQADEAEKESAMAEDNDEESDDDDDDDDNVNNDAAEESDETIQNASDEENGWETCTDEENDSKQPAEEVSATETTASIKNNPAILTRIELIEELRKLHKVSVNSEREYSMIGMVGYPNVGKSSTINALMITKKVSVSATPGKTKHYQTLHLDQDIHLCDCPGLVFPSFVCTKADMLLNGILSIAEMRDPVPPVELICRRIPRHVLEDKYGLVIAKPREGEDPQRSPRADELLLAYSYCRGYMTGRGQPDMSRSARCLCKDYLAGKLLYCIAPPTVSQADYHTFPARSTTSTTGKPMNAKQPLAIPKGQSVRQRNDENTFDNEKFFAIHAQANVKRPANMSMSMSMTNVNAGAAGAAPGEKPWRQKPKKEVRQKLRNKFAHLDLH